MKNLVSNTDKKVEVLNDKKTTLESINLDKINFDKIEKKIIVNKSEFTEKSKNSKDLLYKNLPTDKSKHKSFRSKMRNERKKFENNIKLFYSENRNAELKKELKTFLDFYKSEYVRNDFSVYSLVQSNTNTDTLKDTEKFLKIIKEILSIN